MSIKKLNTLGCCIYSKEIIEYVDNNFFTKGTREKRVITGFSWRAI